MRTFYTTYSGTSSYNNVNPDPGDKILKMNTVVYFIIKRKEELY